MISASTMDEIRSRLDLVELVSEYVPGIKRAGRHAKACCPFHSERTPSFVVSPERQSWHCFGCGEGGDAFSFLMKIERLSFLEAAETLAQRAGVKIAVSRSAEDPGQREKARIKEALEYARVFYQKALSGPEGAIARQYLARRGVTLAAGEAFELGYASGRADLAGAAVKEGFTAEILVKAGLAAERRPGGLRDYFFNRVLFPIRDARGTVVGFGGRALGESEPKYLNSPESPVFSKGKLLYGLFSGLAEIRKSKGILLMEGYMDVLTAHQHGLKTACAPLGTAVTPDQVLLLKRYADEVLFVFDSDPAGQAAALRGAELLMAAGVPVRVCTVPEGKDPDEHLRRFGVKAFAECLDKAKDLAEFHTSVALARYDQGLGPQQKAEVAKAVLSTIAQCPDEVLKEEWVRRLSARLGTSEEALFKQMGKTAPVYRNAAKPQGQALPPPSAAGPALSALEEQLLLLLLRQRGLTELATAEDFISSRGRRIFQALAALGSDRQAPEAVWSARLMDSLSPEDRPALSRLFVDARPCPNPQATLVDLLARGRREARLRELEPRVLALSGSLSTAEAELKEEYRRLMSELKGTKR